MFPTTPWTLNKDLSFRDVAQACYRMRGVGRGQTLRYVLVPEVAKLVRDFSSSSSEDLSAVAALLYHNGFKTETAQGRLLCEQTVRNVWRKRSLTLMVDAARSRRAPPCGLDACVEIFSDHVDASVPNSSRGATTLRREQCPPRPQFASHPRLLAPLVVSLSQRLLPLGLQATPLRLRAHACSRSSSNLARAAV